MRDAFLSSLRSALRHLYNSARLRNSPLVEALGLERAADPASELRQVLTAAIRSLQPEPETPADTELWRTYEILLYRYVQRCTQLEVAEQLGMSTRHLARQERRALQVLAERLRQDHSPQTDGGSEDEAPSPPWPIDDEVSWLAGPAPEETVDLADVLPRALDLVQPMAAQHGVTVLVDACPAVLPLAVHPIALRQILLSLFSVAIRQACGRSVSIAATQQEWNAQVQVRGLRPLHVPGGGAEAGEDIRASLQMARHLIETCGGHLTLVAADEGSAVVATLPALEQLPVLVIDDNANTRRLLQRYASNTRYRVYGAESVSEGLALAREVSPRIVVLDVMMPDMDGWEALGRLRQHPLTTRIPVVICTILAEEELALSLGAAGFVRKPVTREGFLHALGRLAYPAGPESG